MTLSQGVLGAAAEIIWAITVKSARAYCETPRAFPSLNQAPRQPRRRDGLTGSGVASEGLWRSASGGLFLSYSLALVGPIALSTVKCCPGRAVASTGSK